MKLSFLIFFAIFFSGSLVVAQAPVQTPMLESFSTVPLSRNDVIRLLEAGNPALIRANFSILEHQSQLAGYDGLFDTTVNAELTLQRATVPVDSGISSGINRDEQYGLGFSIARRLHYGTTLSAQLNQSIVRNEYTLSFQGFEDMIVRGPNMQTGFTLMFEQPLLQGAGERINTMPLRITELQLDIDDLIRINLASSAVQEAFIQLAELRHLYAQARVHEQVYARAQEQLRIAERLFAHDQIAEFELDLFRGRIALAQESLLVTFAAIESQSSLLRQTFGLGPSISAYAPTNDPFSVPEHLDPVELCVDASDLNPELVQLRATRAMTRLGLSQTQDRLRPSLNLQAGLTTSGLDENTFDSYQQLFGFQTRTLFASIVFSTPLGNETARADQTQQEIALDRLDFDITQMQSSTCLQINELVNQISLFRERKIIAQYRSELAERALDGETRLLEHNLSTIQQTLDALDSFQQAELDQARIFVELEQAWWRLSHQTGSLADTYFRTEAP